ncbi:hypothetical protein [Acinetobacter tjernbergiae]|uniref:Uncharacterized protein n=1 Tax=Acinetobacter tjernbergiae DSM 14971 = CIP 107465 TaxID=1120928 RepID=V2V5L6_9GAMM|nr:hypothetical protein [Acinetobacter tjernbergiae]ESK57562.1 hypothetical protein F990_00098 [Acinetobacter tjernbergiae DSM 14971 = CIP 107465]
MPERTNILQFLDHHTKGDTQPQTMLKFEHKGCKIELTTMNGKENAKELLETCLQAVYLKNAAK